jgi:hypothetical protein
MAESAEPRDLEAWIAVADARQRLIDILKAENRRLAAEVRRLGGAVLRQCFGCGDARTMDHECKRVK